MDPISAFSLACNILQIVDTSAKILVKAAECYNDGATAETSQLSGNVRLLESLGAELKAIDARTSNPFSTSELRLLEANERCLQVSDKLIHLLGGLKVNEKSVWQALSRSIRAIRHRETIAGLRDGVSECRANLNLALLLVMHERSCGMTATTLKAHSDTEARILGTFDQQSTLLGLEIQRLSSRIEGISLDRCEDTMKDFRSVHETQLRQLSQRVVEIIEQQSSALRSQGICDSSCQPKVTRQRILDSLHFPQMQERKAQISDVYEGTYGWIFRDDVTFSCGKDNFVSWLSKRDSQKNVFWVSGKPDGLDELEDTGGRQEQLLDLIQSLGYFAAVKICVSSRPDNIFRDAFGSYPQLLLQELTTDDIQVFIRGQFDKQPRLRTLSQGGDKLIDILLGKIAAASSGVFLWVCLVVTEVLEEARDGAGVAELIDVVEKAPKDLDDYFCRIMDAIEPKHRAESSIMFQIALHEETSYVTLFALRLLDLSFIEERYSDFALRPEYDIAEFDTSKDGLTRRLDSAFRRVNSRSRGLLEVHYVEDDTENLFNLDGVSMSELALATSSRSREDGTGPDGRSQDTSDMAMAFNYHVSFLHRSFHDYLLQPENKARIDQRSKGRYNSRLFLCNARLVQMLSLDYKTRPDHALLAFGLASGVVSAISVDDLKFSKESVQVAAQMQPVVEFLAQSGVQARTETPWYLSNSLEYYIEEQNSFLAVAIDFDLDAYLKAHLTKDAILTKTGRPILDNVLQPTNWIVESNTSHDPHVNLDILRLTLDLGADPNDMWQSVSVWGSFLLSLLDGSSGLYGPSQRQSCVEAVKIMLQYSADPILPAAWFTEHLSKPVDHAKAAGTCQIADTDTETIAVAYILRQLPEMFTTHTPQILDECIILAEERATQRLRVPQVTT